MSPRNSVKASKADATIRNRLTALSTGVAPSRMRPYIITVSGASDPTSISVVLKFSNDIKNDIAAAPISAELTETRTQIAALQKRLDDDAAERASSAKVNEFASQWNGAKAQLQRERGYTAEGIAEIEKLAQERGIPDLEAAAALFDRLHPPPEPVQPAGIGSFNFFEPTEKDGEDMKKLLESRGESEQVVMKMAREALNDFRSGRR